MWRSKAGQLKTTNLCNQFLVIYLTKKKHQFQKHGLQRKAMVYGTALISIKKYPLPIIAELQLKTLYGVGDLLCQQLAPVIRYHYRQFLKQKPQKNSMPPQTQQNQFDDEETLKSKCRSLYQSGNNEQAHLAAKSSIADEDDSKSNYSMQSASVNKPYKPRPKTQAANVILAMKYLSPEDYISTECLKDYFKNEYKQLFTQKQYCLLMDNLIKQGYVQKLVSDQSIKLTSKGISYALILQGKTKAKDSQVKIKSMIMQFRSNIHLNKFASEKLPQKIIKNKVNTTGKNGLVLIIDSRQIKDKNDQSFFQSKLTQKYRIECRTASLPIGDFLWTYQDQVLDYIVERKKADDLASSIYDGRYKQQKLRLKNSTISNIFYLFEGHLTGTHAKSEREVDAALMTTRVRDQFKVVKVVNINQSLKFISFLTQSIAKQLDTKPNIQTLGTLQDFSAANGKSSNLTVQQIFGLSLKTIPGVGKSSVNEVLKFFSSFRELYDQLSQFSCRSDRIQFLKQLLKGCGVRSNLPQLLNDVLFGSQSV